jgi:competence protein ComEA
MNKNAFFHLISHSQARTPLFFLGTGIIVLLISGGLILHALSQENTHSPDSQKPNKEISVPIASPSSESGFNAVIVDVSGAVNKPGIYYFPPNTRVAEVIQVAGGLDPRVDQEFLIHTLNLSKKIQDEEKIIIPFNSSENEAVAVEKKSEKVSINSATLKELDSLPGIGEKRAQDIITQRPYSSLEEFKEKAKISDSIYTKISSFIKI